MFQLFEFEVSEGYPVNTTFGTLVATDADIGSNAIIYYHLLGSSMHISCLISIDITHLV